MLDVVLCERVVLELALEPGGAEKVWEVELLRSLLDRALPVLLEEAPIAC